MIQTHTTRTQTTTPHGAGVHRLRISDDHTPGGAPDNTTTSADVIGAAIQTTNAVLEAKKVCLPAYPTLACTTPVLCMLSPP
mmetsp:Transcript_16120/g.49987  ORF Transcript_16120/g.49987 Transcript_16120/m.49987 type:complete len:82 (-) Transcript_16120:212-457(-)